MTEHTNYSDEARARLIPWIVVGIIAVFALFGAGLFLSTLNSESAITSTAADDTDKAVNNAGAATDRDNSASYSEHETGSSTNSIDSSASSANSQSSSAQRAPEVTVGSTYQLEIAQWDKKLEVSSKLNGLRYELVDNNTRANLSLDLAQSLPESCAALRSQFGFKLEGNKVKAIKPQATCPAAPEVYNEIWGLLEAAAKTAQ